MLRVNKHGGRSNLRRVSKVRSSRKVEVRAYLVVGAAVGDLVGHGGVCSYWRKVTEKVVWVKSRREK